MPSDAVGLIGAARWNEGDARKRPTTSRTSLLSTILVSVSISHAALVPSAVRRTLIAWADAMGHTEAANLLQQTLDEEKAADKKLSALAEGGLNQEAADAAHAGNEEDESELVGAGKRASKGNKTTGMRNR